MHSHTGVERDIQLPFEEMEPCCQKEIISMQREKEFKQKIRAHDRSNVRLDEHKSVFQNPMSSTYSSCACCHSSSDYHLLSVLKAKLLDRGNSSNDAEDNDSDDDFLDGDDYVSPAQEALLQQVAHNSERLRHLATVGLGAHLDESPHHFLQLHQYSSIENIVLHIVDASDPGSAVIDLALEELAQSYPGTYFRRISRASVLHHPAKLFRDINSSRIVSLKGGEVVNQSNDLLSRLFVHNDNESVDEITAGTVSTAKSLIEQHLSHLHVLSEAVEHTHQDGGRGPQQSEEDDPEEVYCDVTGCGRTFPHKHISSGTTPLLLNEAGQGLEALDKSYASTL